MADTFDYAEVAAEALALVTEFGADLTVAKLNTTAADPTKPWRGAADPRAPYADSQTVKAVSVPVTGLGKIVSKKDIPADVSDFWIVAPGLSTPDLTDFDEVVETDGTVSRLVMITQLRPTNVTLLYVLGTLK